MHYLPSNQNPPLLRNFPIRNEYRLYRRKTKIGKKKLYFITFMSAGG